MQKTLIYILVLVGGAAFLGMVKLMYDMTGHMARMTDQVASCPRTWDVCANRWKHWWSRSPVSRQRAAHGPLAEDVHGMRENVGTMTGVLHRGGEQIERLNPMEMMQQMMAPGQRR